MGRSDGRPNAHFQEARPAPAAPAPPAAPEGRSAGWRLAALLWAIAFLFLAALMLFDLIAGLFHR